MPTGDDDLAASAGMLVDHAQDAVDALERRRSFLAQQGVFLPAPTREDGLRMLSLADLLEHLRQLNWRMHHHPDPYGRWWISKHFSSARRELVARGYAPDAWVDGTEEDDT